MLGKNLMLGNQIHKEPWKKKVQVNRHLDARVFVFFPRLKQKNQPSRFFFGHFLLRFFMQFGILIRYLLFPVCYLYDEAWWERTEDEGTAWGKIPTLSLNYQIEESIGWYRCYHTEDTPKMSRDIVRWCLSTSGIAQ